MNRSHYLIPSRATSSSRLLQLIQNATTMPKVISYTPSWLCRPSPGADFFSSVSPKGPAAQPENGKTAEYEGPTRTLARRGTEVFAVVDNQIRWSNLTRLKDEWQLLSKSKAKDSKTQNGSQKDTPDGAADSSGSEVYYRVISERAS